MREVRLNVSISLGVSRVPKINYPQKEKYKMKKMSICIIMLGMFLSVSFGQEQTKFGLGFEFHTFPSIFMMQDGVTSLGIYLPVEAGSLLIEPLVMYSSLSTEIDYDEYGIQDSETSESDFTLLIGILKPTVRGKIRSYYGIRFGKQWHECGGDDYNNNNYYYNSCGGDSEYLIIAPTVGAEYYLSNNFSFGGEGMYSMVTYEEKEDSYTTTFNKRMLIPKFIVRFYF